MKRTDLDWEFKKLLNRVLRGYRPTRGHDLWGDLLLPPDPDRMGTLKGLLLTYLMGECELSRRQFLGLLDELREEVLAVEMRDRLRGLRTGPKASMPRDEVRERQYKSLRLDKALLAWMRKLSAAASRGHAADCVCPACRIRRMCWE